MRYGGPLPWQGPLATRDNLLRFATTCESLGYEWVTAGEHLLNPKQLKSVHPGGHRGADPTDNYEEIFTTFAWLAGQTTNLRFMSAMLIMPYRSPFATAKLVAGLDFVSSGRFTLGTSVGWMKDEYDIFNLPFAERGRMTDEYLSILQSLFTGDGPFRGEYYSYPESWFRPKPIQQPFPIVIGGSAVEPVLRRVARFGSGWWPWPLTCAQIGQAMPRMKELWRAAGRGDEPLQVHAYLPVEVSPARGVLPSREQLLSTVEGYQAVGVTHLTVTLGELGQAAGHISAEVLLDAAAWFSDEIISTIP